MKRLFFNLHRRLKLIHRTSIAQTDEHDHDSLSNIFFYTATAVNRITLEHIPLTPLTGTLRIKYIGAFPFVFNVRFKIVSGMDREIDWLTGTDASHNAGFTSV